MGGSSSANKCINSQVESIIKNSGHHKDQEGCMDTHIFPISKSEIDELYSYESLMCKISYKNENGQNDV